MSSTIDSKPDLQQPQDGQTKRRFTLTQLFSATTRETIVGPNKTGWATTVLYIAGAALCLGITSGFAWLNQPAAIAEYGKVGQKFFADFVDPTLATTLEVSTFDAKNVEPREFKVAKWENDQWVIPSHHNYPADAEEQLANTAASVIGVERGAMVTRWSADHPNYGVVDPKQDSLNVDEVEGVGQRLTLRGENDSVLADFIVGKQVEGKFDQYYVRHPDEDEVYITTLNVDLSTKFSDWIDTNLFDLSTSDVRQVTVNDYSFDELSGRLTQSEVTELSRDGSGNDWQLDSLDTEKEEINQNAIRETLGEITGLAITGVRPKQEGLTPDLKLDRKALTSQSGVDRLQSDLLSSGFLLQPTEGEDKDQLKLIAREGELMAGTKNGLVYRLHFGRAFAGSQEELEIGFVSTKSNSESVEQERVTNQASNEDADGTAVDSDATESTDGDSEAESTESSKPGRYVFVRVDFDKKLLGEELSKPIEPIKSERLIELEEQEAANANSDQASTQNSSENSESGNSTDLKNQLPESSTVSPDSELESEAKSGEQESTEAVEAPEKTELEKLREEFESAKSKYESDLKAYEDYQSKVESGREKAEELNQRFANWYYVISGEAYDNLALNRESFVTAKVTEKADAQNQDDGNESSAPVDGVQSGGKQPDSGSKEEESQNADSSSLESANKNDDEVNANTDADSVRDETADKRSEQD